MKDIEKAASVLESAQTVFLPSGRDNEACIKVLQETFDIDVPDFPGRKLVVTGGGKQFAKVKGKDVPSLVRRKGASVGLAGTDVWMEYVTPDSKLSSCEIGDAMCTFAVLSPQPTAQSIDERMQLTGRPVRVATSYPRMLGVCANYLSLNVVPTDFDPSGSVEAMVALGLAEAVADLVEKGTTARDNDLAVVDELCSIKPTLIWYGT